jgi:hypothetical protein
MNASSINEVEVWLSADGLGRAAIARRNDGLLCIYVHWKLAPDVLANRMQSPDHSRENISLKEKRRYLADDVTAASRVEK